VDEPHDRQAFVLCTALGGTLVADFGDDPNGPRFFAWLAGPCVEGARRALDSWKAPAEGG
jgi:hypothetical protein